MKRFIQALLIGASLCFAASAQADHRHDSGFTSPKLSHVHDRYLVITHRSNHRHGLKHKKHRLHKHHRGLHRDHVIHERLHHRLHQRLHRHEHLRHRSGLRSHLHHRQHLINDHRHRVDHIRNRIRHHPLGLSSPRMRHRF